MELVFALLMYLGDPPVLKEQVEAINKQIEKLRNGGH